MNLLIAAILALAAPQNSSRPSIVDHKTGETPNNEAVSEEALALARVIQPQELVVEVSGTGFRSVMEQVFANDPMWIDAEKKHPGLSKELVDELTKMARDHTLENMPALHRRYARLYARHFSPDEIVELTGLYASPFGQKLIKAKMANLNLDALTTAIVADPETEISAAQIGSANASGTRKAIEQFTEEELRAGLNGLRMLTVMKLRSFQPELMKFEASIANESDPTLETKAMEAIDRILIERNVTL